MSSCIEGDQCWDQADIHDHGLLKGAVVFCLWDTLIFLGFGAARSPGDRGHMGIIDRPPSSSKGGLLISSLTCHMIRMTFFRGWL